MRANWLRIIPTLLSRWLPRVPDTPTAPKPEDLGITYNSLDVSAARRQARLGRDYARTKRTAQQLKELKNGNITLPPHGSWNGDYTDWTADPFNDRNWRFQFHTLRWINPYLWDALDGDNSSHHEWKRIVYSWAQHNTPPENASDAYAWMDMTDGNRAIQLSIGAPLVDASDEWYIDLLVQHRNWLYDDGNIVPGNHGLHQNLGLFVTARVLNDEVGIKKAIQRLGDQIIEAFDVKGLNEEGSVGYHQMNVIWWQQAQKRLKLEGMSFPEVAAERLDMAGRTLGFLLLPDATMPQVGDGNRGSARRGLHPFVDQVIKEEVCDEATPTHQTYDNGFTVFRSGWGHTRPSREESHTIVRHGEDLHRHSHNDRGSVHIYTHGRRWITDGGFHSYQQNEPNRIYTKSRLAHSLIDLPHQNHDVSGNVPIQFTEHTEQLHTIETIDNNFDAAEWKRRVVFLPEEQLWIVWDRVKCETEELIQQQWLIDIGVEVSQTRKNELTLQSNGEQVQLHWLVDQPILDIAEGDPQAASKRGLIGVGWKKMLPATSVHAMFQTMNLDSIVIISTRKQKNLEFELSNYARMDSFMLALTTSTKTMRLSFGPHTTKIMTSG